MMKRKYHRGEASRNARRQAMFETDGNLRKRPSAVYQPVKPTARFKEYVHQELIPDLPLGQRNREKQRDIATAVIANLVVAHKAGGKVLADSRDTGKGCGARVRIYDQLEQADIIRKQLGSEQSGKMTRYALRHGIAHDAREWDFLDVVNPSLDEPTSQRYQPSEFAPVILRPSKSTEPGHQYARKSIPFPPTMSEKELAIVRHLEDAIQAINDQHLFKHTWVYSILDPCGQPVARNQVNPIMRAIFNGDFQHGGRFYSRGPNGYQNLSKSERRTMLIDGEPIAERDYSGFHTRLLYHKEGLDYRGDVYRPEEVFPKLYQGHHPQSLRDAARKYIKTVTNIILNASTLNKAIGAAQREVREDSRYQQVLDICNATPRKIILRIKRIHQPIAHHFHAGTGLSLQCEDSFLMLFVMCKFQAQGKPALSLHDAILCKASDADLAERTMRYIYQLMYEFDPVIKADWPIQKTGK